MADDDGASEQKLVESDPTMDEWKKKEQEIKNEAMRVQLEQLTNLPRKSCLHRSFNFVSFVMGMAGLLMIIGQLVGLYFYEMDPIQGVMRCYVVLMCFLIILNELQWFNFIRESAILRIWITRGIFYSFVGVLGLEENDTENAASHTNVEGRDVAIKFVEVVAYMMVACGIAYFVMGCLCLQLIHTRVVSDYEQRCNEIKANKKRNQGSSSGSIV